VGQFLDFAMSYGSDFRQGMIQRLLDMIGATLEYNSLSAKVHPPPPELSRPN
jgi:hypothetical protein